MPLPTPPAPHRQCASPRFRHHNSYDRGGRTGGSNPLVMLFSTVLFTSIIYISISIFQKQGTISDGRYTPHHSARVGTSRQTAGKQCHPRQPRTTSPPRGTFAHEHSTQHRQRRCGALPFSGAAVHCAEPGWRAYSHGAGMHVGGRCTYRRQQGRSAEPMGASPAQSLVSEVSISESARPAATLRRAPASPQQPTSCRIYIYILVLSLTAGGFDLAP